MRALSKRIQALEGGAKSQGRVFTLFRWSSQDPEEAKRRWIAGRVAAGSPVPGDNDTLMHLVFMDPEGLAADDWGRFEGERW
jgi:hypothetical protein